MIARVLEKVAGGTMEGTLEACAPGIGVAPDRRVVARIAPPVLAAVAAVWLLWGSTFAAMRFVVVSVPPFVMASGRFLLAGAILYAICVVRGRARPTRADVVSAACTAVFLIVFGNGVTAYTVQYLPTGINSLLLSLSPVWMALIAFAWGGERPTRLAVSGMILGFGGLALLLQPKATAGLPLWPALLALASSMVWAFGSIYQRRIASSSSLVLSTALQMLFGGVALGVVAALFGQWQTVDVHAIPASAWIAFAWLVVCGSLIAYSAYLYTMQSAGTALASTYAYVNPVVAVVLGMLLFRERFTPLEAVASAVIVLGVALMMVPARTRRVA